MDKLTKQLMTENYINQVAINEFAAIQAGADELINSLVGLTAIPKMDVLKKMMAGRTNVRPRIMGNQHDFERISGNRNEFNQRLFDKLEKHANRLLAQGIYRFNTAPALIKFTRTSLDIITVLSGMYLMTKNREYAHMAIAQAREAYSVCDSLDFGWHMHSLHVSDLCVAFAICNDWLADIIEENGKKEMTRLVKKQLTLASKYFTEPVDCFGKQINNWNAVCVGGVIVSAIGMYEETDDFWVDVLHKALKCITLSSIGVAPNGASEEGTGYWEYHMNFFVRALATLNAFLGTDFEISELPGVDEAGDFPLYMHSSDFLAFNFGDAGPTPPQTTVLYWLGKHFNKPYYTAYADAVNPNGTNFDSWEDKSLDIFIMLWRTAAEADCYKKLPLAKMFQGRQNCMTIRSSWKKGAMFLGFKGGHTKVPHCNLDLGTFVYDWAGVRWFCDLAKEDYGLEGYWEFTRGRWQYYTQRAEGHNTISVDTNCGSDQIVPSFAPIIPQENGGLVDLSNAYTSLEKVTRRYHFLDNKIIIKDEFVPRKAEEILISFHTQTCITSKDDYTAILSSGENKVQIQFEFSNESDVIDVVTHYEKNFNCEKHYSTLKYRIMDAKSIYISELKGSKSLDDYKKIALALQIDNPCFVITTITNIC